VETLLKQTKRFIVVVSANKPLGIKHL